MNQIEYVVGLLSTGSRSFELCNSIQRCHFSRLGSIDHWSFSHILVHSDVAVSRD